MDRIILVLISIIFLMSCNIEPVDEYKNYFDSKMGFNIDFKLHKNYTNSLEDVFSLVFSEYEYRVESGDFWQSPSITHNLKSGDCEDLSLLILNILYVNHNIKGDLIIVDVNNKGVPNHCIIMIDEKQYNSTSYRCCDFEILYKYSFDEVFN